MGEHDYLVVLDPAAGIMVIDAPDLRPRRRTFRIVNSFDAVGLHEEVKRQAVELRGGIDANWIDRLPVECVLALPNHDEIPLRQLGSDASTLPILTRSHLTGDNLQPAIKRILGHERCDRLSDKQENRARAVVNPEIILRPHVEHLPMFQDPEIAPEDVIRVMDREQERVAEHLGAGYRLLRGVAGSGKTLVLAHRARYLHKHWPDWRILIVCYNRVLAQALKVMTAADDRLEVTNVDRLAHRLAGSSAGSGVPDFDQRVQRALQAAGHLPDSRRFDAVLVDEAQDFDKDRLDLAYAMLKSDRLTPDSARPDRDNFVVAFDVAQNVYRRGGARWNPPGVDAQGRHRTARGRSTVFRKNYRNTREILEFAMNFLTGSTDWASDSVDLEDPGALVPPEAAKRTGPRPRLTVCRDLREEAEVIGDRVRELLDLGTAPDDISVMYGCADLQKEVSRTFEQRGVPGFHVQHRDKSGRLSNRDKAVRVQGMVRMSTLTGMKGLEFSRVFVGGVNQIRITGADQREQLAAAKSQLYAAMTRAMDELEITMSGHGPVGAALREAEHLQRVG